MGQELWQGVMGSEAEMVSGGMDCTAIPAAVRLPGIEPASNGM